MASGATIYHFQITLSDVDRSVYSALDVRLARHPSESLRYLLTRTLAYCLSYEEGIAFSKGGLSSAEEPPVSVRDAGGRLLAWIDVGAPSAERLHKAAKAATKVSIFTHSDLAALRKDAAAGAVHRASAIEVWQLDVAFLDAFEAQVDRNLHFELARNDGELYVTCKGTTLTGRITSSALLDLPAAPQ